MGNWSYKFLVIPESIPNRVSDGEQDNSYSCAVSSAATRRRTSVWAADVFCLVKVSYWRISAN